MSPVQRTHMTPLETIGRRLIVPRIEDLPYWSSPPIQFVYESTAALNAGAYTWTDQPSVLTPQRPLVDNAVYFFRSISLVANIAELDFESNILSAPPRVPVQFYMYLTSDSQAVLFREPIVMNKYYQQFDYRLVWSRAKGANQLLAAFTGIVAQGPTLIGKASITLKAVVSAQEIVDERFNTMLRDASYPGRED